MSRLPPPEIDIATVASELHRAAADAAPSWAVRRVDAVATAQGLGPIDNDRLTAIGREVGRFIDDELGRLLTADIDAQRTTPLSVFRAAVAIPTALLEALGARPVRRGAPQSWEVADDPYGLAPSNLAEVGDGVHQAGMMWGASKAGLHLQRRRDGAQR